MWWLVAVHINRPCTLALLLPAPNTHARVYAPPPPPGPGQLTLLASTNVLVAVHGAGAFNLIWLPPRTSTVLELVHNSRESWSRRALTDD